MIFKKLTTEAEFETYRKGFQENLSQMSIGTGTTQITSDYFKNALPIGVFDENNEMIAGYILNTRPPLRLLDFVPQSALQTLKLPSNSTWDDYCEVTCTWKKNFVSQVDMSYRFWPRVLKGVLETGKQYLLGGNQNAKLDRFHTRLGPVTLYAGPSTFGLPSRLFAYTRAQVKFSIFLLYAWETPRRGLKRLVRGSRG